MKIKSVIVDNLPDSCSDCRMTQWSTEGKRMYCFCVVRDEMVNLIKYPNSRPLNCPLKRILLSVFILHLQNNRFNEIESGRILKRYN